MEIFERLNQIADTGEYREFNKRIVATGYEVLGVRMPDLRKFARQLAREDGVHEYLEAGVVASGRELVYEDVMLYGLVLAARSKKMALEDVLEKLDALIEKFDSWAHVDVIISEFKIFAKYREEVFRHFLQLKTHAGEFHKRTFVIVLMDYFMTPEHIERTLEELAGVPQGQYYVDMAIAWALSVALVKNYEMTLPLLQTPVFTKFVHNKAIQKARESYRISPEQKEFLTSLSITSGKCACSKA